MGRTMFMISIFFALGLPLSLLGQEQTPSQTPRSAVQAIDDETALTEAKTKLQTAKNAYLKAVRDGVTGISDDAGNKGSGGMTGATTFATDDILVKEVVTLSYEALDELTTKVGELVRPTLLNYDRFVFYNENDFKALPRYRFYRVQVKQALKGYGAFQKALQAKSAKKSAPGTSDGGDWMANLGLIPTVGTGVRAVANLMNLFRTDTTITQSKDAIDSDAFAYVLADRMLEVNPRLLLYNPMAFVPEYDTDIAKEYDETRCSDDSTRSFYREIGCLDAAKAYVDVFVEVMSKLPDNERNKPPLSQLIATAKVIQTQMAGLTFTVTPNSDSLKIGEMEKIQSEFLSLVRAEKLERFLTQSDPERTGILFAKVLSSGGSRRERKNLLLGTRTDFGGSAIIRVAIYKLDGTILLSKTLWHHTGFRKMKSNEKELKP